jgi:hypothetical protein
MTLRQFSLIIIAGWSATFALGQTSQSLLDDLKSPDWEQRQAAAKQIALKQSQSPDETAALVALLAHEDGVVNEALLDGTGVANKFGEEYGEYVGALTDAVSGIAEKNTEQPGIWPALVNAPWNADSAFVGWLAKHADHATPLLMAIATGPDPSPESAYTSQAVEALGRILAFQQNLPTPQITISQMSAIGGVARSALESKSSAVRMGAVHALAAMGGSSDLPTLERTSRDPVIGKEAQSAIAEIKARLNSVAPIAPK